MRTTDTGIGLSEFAAAWSISDIACREQTFRGGSVKTENYFRVGKSLDMQKSVCYNKRVIKRRKGKGGL